MCQEASVTEHTRLHGPVHQALACPLLIHVCHTLILCRRLSNCSVYLVIGLLGPHAHPQPLTVKKHTFVMVQLPRSALVLFGLITYSYRVSCASSFSLCQDDPSQGHKVLRIHIFHPDLGYPTSLI